MNWPATIANSIWAGSNLLQWHSFRSALKRPAEAQRNLLRKLLASNAGCAYGRAHAFEEIRDYSDFARRVPLMDYENLEPWIERIRCGEQGVLTAARVTHLIPTSGSMGARKLIPFTTELQKQFDRAIGPWVADLALGRPQMLAGPAYWSITPPQKSSAIERSLVPVGFADDASYLGGAKGWLVRAAMIVPEGLSIAADLDDFRFRTLYGLVRERELRLISVWHPSFLSLLLDALPNHWGKILARLHVEKSGRAGELEHVDPHRPETLWPRLSVISCWGDSHAELPLADLRRRFPGVFVQPKGLLATEAVMTIPFAGSHPVAVCSHFFEFIDAQGRMRLVHELQRDETYEVVVTTAGGLWRYRMHDLVRVAGITDNTPSLRFVGKAGNVSDLFGEKLSEAFAADAIRQTLAFSATMPRFALLAPDQGAAGWHYTLYVEGNVPDGAAETLERTLCRNPNYNYCRDIGQLQPVEVFVIKSRGFESFAKRLVSEGKRLGDIKPVPLCGTSGWSKTFMTN